MVLLRCDGCGGFEFKEVNGLRVCVNCGLQYDPNIIQEQVTKFANTYNINYNIQNLNAQNVYLSGNPDFEIAGGTLIKYHGQSQNVVIPENVVCIGENAFANTSILTVKFPKGLKSIKKNAFNNCDHLYSVNFTEGLTELGWGSFSNCRKLKKISIPNSVGNNDAPFTGDKINELNIYSSRCGFQFLRGINSIKNLNFHNGILLENFNSIYTEKIEIETLYIFNCKNLSDIIYNLNRFIAPKHFNEYGKAYDFDNRRGNVNQVIINGKNLFDYDYVRLNVDLPAGVNIYGRNDNPYQPYEVSLYINNMRVFFAQANKEFYKKSLPTYIADRIIFR